MKRKLKAIIQTGITVILSQVAKTPPFHGGNTSSNLVPIISRIEEWQSCKVHTLETGGLNPPPAILMACSSVVERLTVNQDVVGSIPTLPVSMRCRNR